MDLGQVGLLQGGHRQVGLRPHLLMGLCPGSFLRVGLLLGSCLQGGLLGLCEGDHPFWGEDPMGRHHSLFLVVDVRAVDDRPDRRPAYVVLLVVQGRRDGRSVPGTSGSFRSPEDQNPHSLLRGSTLPRTRARTLLVGACSHGRGQFPARERCCSGLLLWSPCPGSQGSPLVPTVVVSRRDQPWVVAVVLPLRSCPLQLF